MLILDNLINSKNKQINEYKAEIKILDLGIQDADDAKKRYEEAISELDQLIDEISICFKGESADAFVAKVLSLRFAASATQGILSFYITSYNRRIDELKTQIDKCKGWVDFYNDFKNLLTWTH